MSLARYRRHGSANQPTGRTSGMPRGVAVESSPLGAAHGRDEVIPWRMHEKGPLAHAPILPLLRALGRHGTGCEKATEHAVSLSAAKAGWCPESASRPAVRVSNLWRAAAAL